MKFSIKSFGCKVNQYEIQKIKETLESAGAKFEEKPDGPHFLFINTCAITENTIDKLKRFCRAYKKKNKDSKIAIIGCAVEYIKKNYISIDSADYYFDNSQKQEIKKFFRSYLIAGTVENNIIQRFDNHSRAFVKIQDGCDNFCSYCIVPYLRNNLWSRTPEEISEEIKTLIENGYYEIVITGINIEKYNSNGFKLENLIKFILQLKNNFRLRFSSINVNAFTPELIKIIKESDLICPHFHISLQSGSDKILYMMRRKYSASAFVEIAQTLMETKKDCSITTDVIVGFPDETEKDFYLTLDVLNKIKCMRTHIFPFSLRKGVAAEFYENKIPEAIIRNRRSILQDETEKLTRNFIEKRIGKKYTIIPELENNVIYGYTENYIRGKINSVKNTDAKHKIIPVKIISYDEMNKNAVFEISQ